MSQNDSRTRLSRRRFLQGIGATAGLIAAPAIIAGGRPREPDAGSDLFALGVASGDPDHQSVVLWTRLAPCPSKAAAWARTRSWWNGRWLRTRTCAG